MAVTLGILIFGFCFTIVPACLVASNFPPTDTLGFFCHFVMWVSAIGTYAWLFVWAIKNND